MEQLNLKKKYFDIVQVLCLGIAILMIITGAVSFSTKSYNQSEVSLMGVVESATGDVTWDEISIIEAEEYQDFPGLIYACLAIIAICIIFNIVSARKETLCETPVLKKWYMSLIPLVALGLFIYITSYLDSIVFAESMDSNYYDSNNWMRVGRYTEFTASGSVYFVYVLLSLNFLLDVAKKIIFKNQIIAEYESICEKTEG